MFKLGSKEEKKPILRFSDNLIDLEKGDKTSAVRKYDSLEEIPDEKPEDDSPQGNFFKDGITKIDFILVYEIVHKKRQSISGLSQDEAEELKQKNVEALQQQKWRKKYLKNLTRAGLKLETAESVSEMKVIYYIKVNCPWDVLLQYAEEMNLRAPLQLRERKTHHHWSAFLLEKFSLPNPMQIEVPKPPSLFFTCKFKKSKLDKYLGSANQDEFFSSADRSKITYEILQATPYGKKRLAEIGIDRLLSEEAFTAAFPLHTSSYRLPEQEVDPETLTYRQILHEYWARWGRWYKYQPLDHIREYFGEKIAMYFAWLGFYTAWLLPVAFIGLIVFILGGTNFGSDIPGIEVCNSGENYTMCPLCTMCDPWYLSKSCWNARLSFLFDNGGTVFFAILMSFWAVFFLEFWKRKSAKLAYHWEVVDFQDEERPRPDYNARAPNMEVNPITGVMEPHFPKIRRLRRIFTGFAIMLIMLTVVIIFVLSVIIYKGIIGIVMHSSRNEVIHGQAGILRSLSGAVLSLILIMLMASVYTAVAELLTKWEMHRTQTDYENALTFKVFIFQFVNYYSSIFYIAFFKGSLSGYPGHYQTTLGIRNESCGTGGCLIELAQQLFVIMVGKQAINNTKELLAPKLKRWWKRRQLKKNTAHEQKPVLNKPWEIDYHKLVDFEGLFEEYLEMVLQFGFITIFVAAFPLAPLFALLNNWIEIRLDAGKLICETRRPVTERALNIGVWYEILDALVQIAVVTNAFLIAFTSEFIPRFVYKNWVGNGTLDGYTNFTLSYAPNVTGLGGCRYKDHRDEHGHPDMYYFILVTAKLTFVIAFEHVVFFVGRMIDWAVPDVPETLRIKIKRENYLAKQALTDNIVLDITGDENTEA